MSRKWATSSSSADTVEPVGGLLGVSHRQCNCRRITLRCARRFLFPWRAPALTRKPVANSSACSRETSSGSVDGDDQVAPVDLHRHHARQLEKIADAGRQVDGQWRIRHIAQRHERQYRNDRAITGSEIFFGQKTRARPPAGSSGACCSSWSLAHPLHFVARRASAVQSDAPPDSLCFHSSFQFLRYFRAVESALP